ncbi:NERD domain-containing protein [Oculatella sp. LEGE 06141]|uniref:nuclease-related domain-containing protein n=1 Tax=Oculatella sp. LEGE 06141 TaxID=1828648 RepID=UPI00187EA606|nr:nuclease-related domain-containing protein [Oculatella sp. LEGE 06141]MBE9181249.1 NERD domain-containing protein [Oculatella sp. LEGE 06141]
MIIKELDPFTATDLFSKAGRAAEEQLAFYLRRSFHDRKDLYIFNNLRLQQNGDAAQIDHLIFHKYGMVIVESKSVTCRVQINDYGEWTRVNGSRVKGMPSPIHQAKRQGDFLRAYLEQHVETLLKKFLGFYQCNFSRMPIDILVAISDSGIINRPRKNGLPEVCKADQIPDKVLALFERRQKASNLLNFDSTDPLYALSDDAIARVIHFLLKHHHPLEVKNANLSQPQASTSQAIPCYQESDREELPQAKPDAKRPQTNGDPLQLSSKPICRYCQSADLAVMYGKYGYYFKCSQCDGNTPIKATCSACSEKGKIRKSRHQFYVDCDRCNASNLFYTNRAT